MSNRLENVAPALDPADKANVQGAWFVQLSVMALAVSAEVSTPAVPKFRLVALIRQSLTRVALTLNENVVGLEVMDEQVVEPGFGSA
ncbi:hypothetical protein MAFF211271_40660 (plasmid) [Ralstonia syzygii subsp. indonesiensis]|nr:hypothetical protein MAFF211271_40660 [Ralstonia pseudosolanacearum]